MAVVASTGTELKFTTPLPVLVVIVIVFPKTRSLVELNTTPVTVPVVMNPFNVVTPVVVTLKEARAVVVPAAPKVIAPEPEVMVKPWVLAVLALTGMPLKLTAPLPVEVVMVILLPKMMPLAPAVKTTLDALFVVMEPLIVIAPVVVTLNDAKAVVVPAAPKVIAPEPEVIVKPWVLAVVALTGTELKFTTPLPVVVVIVIVFPKTTLLVELNTTPVAVPVVIDPFNVVTPVVVTLNEARAVVVPTTPNVIAPEPEVIVKPCVLAVVAFTGIALKLTAPLPAEVVMVSVLPKMIPLAPAVKTTLEDVPIVIEPLSVMAPVVVTVK